MRQKCPTSKGPFPFIGGEFRKWLIKTWESELWAVLPNYSSVIPCSSLKWPIVGIFVPWKSAKATNWGLFFFLGDSVSTSPIELDNTINVHIIGGVLWLGKQQTVIDSRGEQLPHSFIKNKHMWFPHEISLKRKKKGRS